MSEQDLISDPLRATPDRVATTTSTPPSGYGARLAWERQRAGLGVTDVAASLRLHPNQVRAIEQEDLARLPELAYVRGFIRSYARVLNIDPAPILSDFNAKLEPTQVSVVDGMPGTGDYSPVRAATRERVSRQVVLGGAVVGLIVLGLVGWQTAQQNQAVEALPVAPAVSAAVTPVAAPAAEPPPATAENTASTTDSAATAAEPAVSDSAPSANEAPPTLLLRFDGASWVEITDANGKILLSQLSAAGAEHALDGDLPLTVVIGDAGKTSVEVRGEAFDLQPFTRNNVARFAVK